MGIRDNGGGGSGGSGGRISARKTADFDVASLLRETGQSVGLLQASLLVSLFFYFRTLVFVSVNVFAFGEASSSNVFSQKKGK